MDWPHLHCGTGEHHGTETHGAQWSCIVRITVTKLLVAVTRWSLFFQEQQGWNPGCGKCQSKFLQTPCNGVFTLKLICPLCFPQWTFSYATFMKGCGDGLKIWLISRSVHLFVPNVTSLNGVCSSIQVWPCMSPAHRPAVAEARHQHLPRKSFRVPPATRRVLRLSL